MPLRSVRGAFQDDIGAAALHCPGYDTLRIRPECHLGPVEIGIGIPAPRVQVARGCDGSGAIVFRVGRQGCVSVLAQRFIVVVVIKPIGHSAQFLRGVCVMRQGDGCPRRLDGAPVHLALDVGRETQLPRL